MAAVSPSGTQTRTAATIFTAQVAVPTCLLSLKQSTADTNTITKLEMTSLAPSVVSSN